MADEEDIAALNSGSTDLVRRDFRQANFRGRIIGARDFSYAHLEKADFSRSDLSGSNFEQAHLIQLNLESTNLSSSKWKGGLIQVNFHKANLRSGILKKCIFHKCNLKDTDLRGTNFQDATIQDETTFEGAIVDESTLFDGVKIMRSIARQDAFRFYEVDRGTLRRIPEGRTVASNAPRVAERDKLLGQIEALKNELRRLEAHSPAETVDPRLGHNNPPEATPLDRAEHELLQNSLTELQNQATTPSPDEAKIRELEGRLTDAGSKIFLWLSRHINLASEEFSKGIGKNLSDPLKLTAAWAIFSGNLSGVIQAARTFFGI